MNVASAIIGAAELRLRPPAPSLRPFVGCFWSITTTTATRLRTLPDACSTLCVEGANSKGPKCFLIGPQLTPSERTPGAGQVFFGVRLRPGVAFLLTRRAVHEVTDRRVALADIMPDDVARMERQIAALVRTEEQLNILEEFLLLRLNCVQIDSRVDDALQQIERCGGELRVSQLARDCQVSSRHLDRLLRTWVGLSPKRMARIVRFQVLLQRIETSRAGGTAPLAAELGYYDQSHLANEVAKFTAESSWRIARHFADFSKTRCE